MLTPLSSNPMVRAHLGNWALFPLQIPPPTKSLNQPTPSRAWAEAAFCLPAGAGPAQRGIQNSQSHKEKALEGKYDSMRIKLAGEGVEPYILVPSPGIAHAYCTED